MFGGAISFLYGEEAAAEEPAGAPESAPPQTAPTLGRPAEGTAAGAANGGRAGSRPPQMTAAERKLTRDMIEEKEARRKSEEAINKSIQDLQYALEQVHAKLDEPLLAKLDQPASKASGGADHAAMAQMKAELDIMRQKLAAVEGKAPAMSEGAVRALVTERLEAARQAQEKSLTEKLGLVNTEQEEWKAKIQTELQGLMNMWHGVAKPGLKAADPKIEELQLLRQLERQLKDLEETHATMAQQANDFGAAAATQAQAGAGEEVMATVRSEATTREIGNMVRHLVQKLKVDVDANKEQLENYSGLLEDHGQRIKDLDAAVFDLQSKQTLTAVRATKLALRSAELSDANRAQALASLEAREKAVKADIDKLAASREDGPPASPGRTDAMGLQGLAAVTSKPTNSGRSGERQRREPMNHGAIQPTNSGGWWATSGAEAGGPQAAQM